MPCGWSAFRRLLFVRLFDPYRFGFGRRTGEEMAMAVRAKKDFMYSYIEADAEGKFCMLMKHCGDFPKIIHRTEMKLEYLIKKEREYLKYHNRGELGVRVQTSTLSNPTEDEAEFNLSVEEVIKSGVFNKGLLRDSDEAAEYEEKIYIIRVMKSDYELFTAIMEDMDDDEDIGFLKEYMISGKSIQNIAAEAQMSYEALKKRMSRLREKIRDEIIDCLDANSNCKFSRPTLREGM